MQLQSSSSPILGSIRALKVLEPESSLSRCKSAKLLSSSGDFGSGTWNLEAELHKTSPQSFKPTHKVAVVVDRMGSEKPSFSERKNGVLRPGGGEKEGSGSSPVVRNSQSESENKNEAMYIARGYGVGGGNQEVSMADSVSDRTDVYYQKMLEANPGNSLLLRNYAKFLHEVKGNLAKAEEYYERAILASPGSEGGVDDAASSPPTQHHSSSNSGEKMKPSGGQPAASAKVLLDFALAKLHKTEAEGGGEGQQIDNAKLAAAAADVLAAAKQYGKMDGTSYGNYVDKAEGYLQKFGQKKGSGNVSGQDNYARPPSSHSTGYAQEDDDYERPPSSHSRPHAQEDDDYERPPASHSRPHAQEYGNYAQEDEDYERPPSSHSKPHAQEDDDYERPPASHSRPHAQEYGNYAQEDDDYERPPASHSRPHAQEYGNYAQEDDNYERPPASHSRPHAQEYGNYAQEDEEENKYAPQSSHSTSYAQKDEEENKYLNYLKKAEEYLNKD